MPKTLSSFRRRLSRQAVAFLLVAVFLAFGATSDRLLLTPTASAATFSVTTANDNGAGSLRQAITDANNNPGADSITFAAALTSGGPVTINLESALPDLSTDINIDGPGANLLTVARSAADVTRFRIFTIPTGVTVNITGLTITGGLTADGLAAGPPSGNGGYGGGISNQGTLTLSSVVVSGNQTGKGGDNSSGAGGYGGQGGGIINYLGALTISNSTISSNTTGAGGSGSSGFSGGSGGVGGGLQNFGTLTISNSTISGNQTGNGGNGGSGAGSGGQGGGLANGGTLTITNSTISGNQTGNDGGGGSALPGGGGGIANFATVTVSNSTITANITADGDSGGGVFNLSGTSNVGNTVIAGNTTVDFAGTLTSQGHNLIGNTSGTTITGDTTGNILNQDPLLGPLQNNGGPTMTHAFSCNSPARDAGSNALAAGLTTDQRGPGFVRIVNTTVDIGAVELGVCNQPPIANVDSYSTNQNTPLSVAAPGVLSNDSDPNLGDTLTAVLVSGPTNAQSFSLNSNGSFNYTPSNNFSGGDSFTYKANDGVADSNTVTVSITVAPTSLRVNDAKVTEPSSGTANMIFTVTLSAPASASGVTVNFTTTDNTPPSLTTAIAGQDYTTTSGTLTFAAGEQFKSIVVPVLSDNKGEQNETFLFVLSNAVNGTIADDTATGTILNMNQAGTFLITEIRTNGPGGAGDDFVEVYNNSDSPLTLAASDASFGYGLFKMAADCNATPILLGVIPNGAIIPARAHGLFVGSQYSLANYGGAFVASGNLTLISDIETDANIGIFSTTEVGNLSSVNRLDAVSFAPDTGRNVCLLSEGTALPETGFTNLEGSYQRDQCGKLANSAVFGNCSTNGLPKDTNNNLADFFWADTAATNTSAGRHLGAPGPENLASPRLRLTGLPALFIDATQPATLAPNRVRDLTGVTNGALGTMTIRRRYRNDTGGPVTRLRFRIVDISTAPVPAGIADLRALTSSDVVVSSSDAQTCTAFSLVAPCSVTVNGTTVESPPAQAIGGGNNTTMTVTLGAPLPAAASINVQWRLGVQTSGSFKFVINVEALP